MATPIFPGVLPGVSSLSWGPGAALTTDADSGPQLARRLSNVPDATAQVSWRFLENDFQIFLDFWEQDLLRGHRWFMLVLPCGAGYLSHVVRFKSYHSAKSDGFNYRTVSAQLEVRERLLRKPAVPISVTSRPYPLYTSDNMGNSVSVTRGVLTQGTATTAVAEYGTSAFVSDGKFTEYVPVEVPPQIDGIQMLLPGLLSFELKTILHIQNHEDRVGMGVGVTAGKLKDFIIQREQEDAYGSTCVIVSGYLT